MPPPTSSPRLAFTTVGRPTVVNASLGEDVGGGIDQRPLRSLDSGQVDPFRQDNIAIDNSHGDEIGLGHHAAIPHFGLAVAGSGPGYVGAVTVGVCRGDVRFSPQRALDLLPGPQGAVGITGRGRTAVVELVP